MSTPHKATAEQWSDAGAFASDTRACLLELRARVEALEEAENDRRFEQAKAIIDRHAPAPASSLVERVAMAADARAAIHEVAAWFTTITPRGSALWRLASEVLREEADR